eukprot:TRINITY_DN2170_c0_g3_i1.p1 TRINITY_DN2170_c0_g3~~TRINITY_DN2170_c0_g3_i1.p1  ORF type:complete len:748 (+),score=163.75 TRINITY_DN2170_c0_g3_i1:174-2417(+)
MLIRNELSLRLYKMKSKRLVKPALIYISKALLLSVFQHMDIPELRTMSWKLTFNSAVLAVVLLRVKKPVGMMGLVLVVVYGIVRDAIRAYDCVIALGQWAFCVAVQYSFAKYQEEITEFFTKRIKDVFVLLPMPLMVLDKNNSVTFKNEEAFEFFDKFKDVHRGSIELFFKSLLEMNKSGTSLYQNLEQFQKDAAASIQGQMKWIQDYSLKTLHTNYFNVKMLCSNRLPLPSQDDKLLLIFTDISAKEILREQVELDNMKSALIAMISHELRTPLNGIIGILYIVSEKLSKEVKTWWNTTFASAQVLANTVNCMVDFSCLETDQFRVCNGCLDIREVFAELAELFNSLVVKDKVRLTHRVSKDVPHTFKTDPVRVKQILMNLLTNSVNYTHNGSVAMSAGMCSGRLKIEVKDTGVGISKESQESLMSVLEDKCGRARFTAYKSAGLGLTISSRLVKALGGTMSFKSVIEIGSTFTFVLKEFEKTNSCQLKIDDKKATEQMMEADKTNMELQLKKRRGTHVNIELEKLSFTKTAELLRKPNSRREKRDLIEETKLKNPCQFSEINSDSDMDGSICDELSSQEENKATTLTKHSLCKSTFDFESGVCMPQFMPEERSAPTDLLQIQRGVEILIVDDITINRLVLSGMLKNIGYTPKEAFNGREACKLVLASNIRFNIVLMDVQMPIMDGIEATINIRQTYNSEQLPIIGVTALSSEPEVEKCIMAGMNEVMVKPLSLNNLKLLIERYKL